MRYPFVKQEGQMECGVACILMLIKYYNGYISTNKLKIMTKTTKCGTTVFNMVKALREIGFSADGVECDFNTLLKNNNMMPCICHVIINKSYNHFVVLYKINNNNIVIADPALGIKKLSFSDFKKIYNNILILAKPNKIIPNISDNKNYNLFKIIKNNKNIIILVILYSLLITFLSITNSFYFGKLIDSISYKSFDFTSIIFIFFFIIKIISLLFFFFRNKLYFILNKRFDIEFTNDIFSSILSLPYQHYKNYTTGDIFYRINDASIIKDSISKFFIDMASSIPIVISSLIILFIINKYLSFICISIIFAIFIFSLACKKTLSPLLNKLKRLKSIDTSMMIDTINSYETVKGINIKNVINNRINNKHIEYLNFNKYFSNLLNIRDLILKILTDLGIIIIQYLGILLVIDNKISISTLVTYNTILGFLFTSFASITECISTYTDFKISLKRIDNIMYKYKDNGFLSKFNNGDILYNNFSFSFDDINYCIKNVNLKINKSERLVVIGKSGSGKSTLFKVLKGYYNIDYDSITINNIDIKNYKNNILCNKILYINQNEILYNDTLINNILIDNCSEEKLVDICNICSINDIIKNNNLGFNMMIEENGFNLSGGQRQRIVMARSLIKDFDILIIDEALNQLDIYSEKKILSSIFNYYPSKTIIFITHRLNNCNMFNHLIEMKEGMIIKDEYIKNR